MLQPLAPAQALEAGQLPAAPAAVRELVRRTTRVLTGLPAAPDDIRTLAEQPSLDAFQARVDRLLGSPRHFEQLAAWSLRLCRYRDELPLADGTLPLPHAWRHRDWLVDAFSAGLPLQRWTALQLCGDVGPWPSERARAEALSASSFMAFLPPEPAGDAPRRQLERSLEVFAGLRLSCARCHRDPGSGMDADDVAGLARLFSGALTVRRGEAGWEVHAVPTAGSRQIELRRQQMAEIRKLEAALERLRRAAAEEAAALFLPQTAEYVRAAWQLRARPETDREKFCEERGLEPGALREWERELLADGGAPWQDAWERAERTGTAEAVSQAAELIQSAATPGEGPFFRALLDLPQHFTRDAQHRLRRLEAEAEALRAGLPDLREVHAPFQATAPESEAPAADGLRWRSRTDLARWLAGDGAPVLARWLACSLWLEFFSEPLARWDQLWAREPPPRAGLIDALAAQLVQDGWSGSALLRSLALSRRWMEADAPAAEFSPRAPTPAERRDAFLAASGRLDGRMRGPPDDLSSERRTLHLHTTAAGGWSEDAGRSAAAAALAAQAAGSPAEAARELVAHLFGRPPEPAELDDYAQFAAAEGVAALAERLLMHPEFLPPLR